MLNEASRNMDADLIITMVFFLRDLHQNIFSLHSVQFTISSEQSLSKNHFDHLQAIKGGTSNLSRIQLTLNNK